MERQSVCLSLLDLQSILLVQYHKRWLFIIETWSARSCKSHVHFTAITWASEYAISQLRIVRSDLHLVTYLDVGNFCDKSTETTLHEICVQVFLRFSDSSKPGLSVSSIYELACRAGIRKSEENLLKTSRKVASATKVAHIFWWRHNNRKQSTSAREHWCDVSCDIPYWGGKMYEIYCHQGHAFITVSQIGDNSGLMV